MYLSKYGLVVGSGEQDRTGARYKIWITIFILIRQQVFHRFLFAIFNSGQFEAPGFDLVSGEIIGLLKIDPFEISL